MRRKDEVSLSGVDTLADVSVVGWILDKGRIVPLSDGEGRKLHVQWATGFSANSPPFKDGSCEGALDERVFVLADEFPRVQGFER